MSLGLINVPNPLSLAMEESGHRGHACLWNEEELETWRAFPLFPVSFTAQVGARWKGIGKEQGLGTGRSLEGWWCFSSATKLLEWVVGTVGLFSKLGLSLLVGGPERLNVLPASSCAVWTDSRSWPNNQQQLKRRGKKRRVRKQHNVSMRWKEVFSIKRCVTNRACK